MQTQTKTHSPSMSANLADLPIFKHINETEIVTKVDSFRNGEKNMFWFFKLAVLGAVGYFSWVYVLPVVFSAIGAMLAIAATGVMVVFGIIAAPVIIKGIRMFTRFLHKQLINFDPFAQLELERLKMINNQVTFRIAKQNILALKQDMELEASKAQEDAENGQKRILTLQGKAEKIKVSMDNLIKELGPSAKGEDAYVDLAAQLQKTLAEAQRISNKLKQSKDFVEKYGSRANVMKKMNQKLVLVETAMEIKIEDFDATIEMLKKDYSFGQKSNAATTAAYSALGVTRGWEFDYALESITATIAADIAVTSGNLRDIDNITKNYSLDSDELYSNLNLLADNIRVGKDIVPEAKKYSNPEYNLTSNDKLKSGGFGEMF